MSKSNKIILLIATVWPFLYMAFFLSFVVAAIFQSFTQGTVPTGALPVHFMTLLFLHLFTMVEMIMLLGIYMYLIIKNERMEKDDRVLWVLLVLFSSFIGMTLYWYLFIWNTPHKKKHNIR